MEEFFKLLQIMNIRQTMANIMVVDESFHQPVNKKFDIFLKKEVTEENINSLIEEGNNLLEERKKECLEEIRNSLLNRGTFFNDDIFSDRIN